MKDLDYAAHYDRYHAGPDIDDRPRTLWTVRFEFRRADDTVVRVYALDEHDARNRAVRKAFGRKAFWWADSGLRGWGQVCVPSPETNSNRCITDRIYANILKGRHT